jgi:hypothetical protein
MRVLKSSVFWGLLMVIAGGLLLLKALDALEAGGMIWSALLGAAGVGFVYVFSRSREHWWAAIPAGTLLGLATLVAWAEFGPASAYEWGGSFFLGVLGAGFWAVYLRGRENWWAIIPGGALLTLALVAGLSSVVGSMESYGVFFFGLALTFTLLAVLPTDEGRMRWTIIPAVALGVLGALVSIGAGGALNYVWPAALVVGGLYLILRAFGPGGRLRLHG